MKNTQTSANVVLDSISPNGDRLTTIEVTLHRFVLAELNTHRVFSRNSASSRAIPFRKQVERVLDNPAVPVSFPAEQRGMQGGDEIDQPEQAEHEWLAARDAAVEQATRLANIGVHKSVVNRLLEPFMWHTVIITATDWDGFWLQRCHPAAQPEIRVAAELMREAYDSSVPVQHSYHEWHTPYIDTETADEIADYAASQADYGVAQDRVYWQVVRKVSAARCARVSYLTHDGQRSIDKDLELYSRLVDRGPDNNDPVHWSPLEHVAIPASNPTPGNLRGWMQLRHYVGGQNAHV